MVEDVYLLIFHIEYGLISIGHKEKFHRFDQYLFLTHLKPVCC